MRNFSILISCVFVASTHSKTKCLSVMPIHVHALFRHTFALVRFSFAFARACAFDILRSTFLFTYLFPSQPIGNFCASIFSTKKQKNGTKKQQSGGKGKEKSKSGIAWASWMMRFLFFLLLLLLLMMLMIQCLMIIFAIERIKHKSIKFIGENTHR